MDEFEMAFFYGDFSQLHELARQVLSEIPDETTTAE